MKWTLLDRGFLPTPDPLPRLAQAEYAHVEDLAKSLPRLIQDRRFRDLAPASLRPPLDWRLPENENAAAERLFLLFSYFASAYVHAPGLPAVQRLPAAIAQPLVRLAQLCGRPPILAYASYCLHNWRRIRSDGLIALGNLELLQNFSTPGDGKKDEDGFILVHVDIEARAGAALTALRSLADVGPSPDEARLAAVLHDVQAGLHAMNRTRNRMPQECSDEVYFRKVRPYIFGFDKIVYEGCFDDVPQTYRGETGAQSSIVPTVLAGLGIRHKDSLLTRHLDDMRHCMPPPHRQFIAEQVSVREPVLRLAGTGPPGHPLKELYNACVSEVIAFRTRHFEYAINYIQKKVDNPLATGGTPYVPWLKQLIEETKEQYLEQGTGNILYVSNATAGMRPAEENAMKNEERRIKNEELNAET